MSTLNKVTHIILLVLFVFYIYYSVHKLCGTISNLYLNINFLLWIIIDFIRKILMLTNFNFNADNIFIRQA